MTKALQTHELVASSEVNPYAPSRQPSVCEPRSVWLASKSFLGWRVYLALHLLVIAATCVMTIADRANYYHRSAFHDAIIPWGAALGPIAGFGILMAFAAPLVTIVLLVKATKHGPRFALAAGAEAILMLAHFFALLPAVQ